MWVQFEKSTSQSELYRKDDMNIGQDTEKRKILELTSDFPEADFSLFTTISTDRWFLSITTLFQTSRAIWWLLLSFKKRKEKILKCQNIINRFLKKRIIIFIYFIWIESELLYSWRCTFQMQCVKIFDSKMLYAW